jgi:methionine sulfoxide reductase heme-binding subunit
MSAVDLSADTGLVALWLLTANLLVGLLLGVRYNPWTHWPHRRFNYFEIHNWTGYIALAVAALHPTIVLFSSTAGFKPLDILWTPQAPKQAFVASLGALGLWTLGVVVLTSYFRRRLRRRSWKALHYLAYVAAAAFYAHGLLMDPQLKNRPVDWFDGEKVSVEVCLLLLGLATALRLHHALRRRAEGVATPPRRLGATPVPDIDVA